MARKIVFETEVNQDGFSKGLAMMEARANQAMGRQAERQRRLDSMTGGGYMPGRGGFVTGGAPMGVAQDAAHAKKMNLTVAASMFTSVARDSAASLASGAPITQVIAQQAPQVLQALAMMNAGMKVWVGVVGIAAVYAWSKLTTAIGLAVTENNKFIGQARYYEKRADDIRKIRRELEDLSAAERSAGAAAIERSKKQEDADRKSLDAERDAKRIKLEADLIAGNFGSEGMSREKARQEIGFLQEDLASLMEKGPSKSAEVLRLQNEIAAKQRWPAEETILERDARNTQRASLEADLAAAMKAPAREFADAVLQLQNKIGEKQNEVAQSLRPGSSSKLKGYLPGSDSLVSVGNFIGSARSKVEGTAQRQLEVLKMIEQNTRKTGGSTAGYPPL